MRELLTMQNVTARYQSPDGELTAAENISLTVSQGEFVSIVGPSGCGKSTLLTIMAGLKRPSEGKVLLDGEPITGPGGKIGYMLQKTICWNGVPYIKISCWAWRSGTV